MLDIAAVLVTSPSSVLTVKRHNLSEAGFLLFRFFFVIGVHMISFNKSCFIETRYLSFVSVSITIPLIFELLRH